MNIQIQEALRTTKSIHANMMTPMHTIIKLSQFKDRENFESKSKVGLHQTKKLLFSKENNHQPMEWMKIFAHHTSDKGFLSKIHKEFIHLKIKK